MEKSKQTVEEVISELQKRGYRKSVDTIGEYLKGGDLYTKQLSDKCFVVFNHFNKGKKDYFQGFDCWIGNYNAQNEIGKVYAEEIEQFKLTFDFNSDWNDLQIKIDEIKKSNQK